MNYLPHIIGFMGVICFTIGYQQKSRKGILIFNLSARICFIIQYILLLAFDGAVQNLIGGVCALMAEHKNKDIFAKRIWMWVGIIWILTISAGIASWSSIFSLLPIIGMVLQNAALWLNKPKTIRLLSFAGLPFWFIYNLHQGAIMANVSDVMCGISMITGLVRHDLKKGTEK